jgi:DNA-binding NarL/FixJ family response regulator
MKNISIALVEDDVEVCLGLQEYLLQQTEFGNVLACGSIDELVEQLRDYVIPQVLLLDINLPTISGTEALPMLKRKFPEMEVIMLTVFDDTEHIYQALCAGATGYLAKATPLPQVKEAILEVARGGAPMSRGVARKVLSHFRPTPTTQPTLLTPREQQVLQGIIDGLGDKQIALRMDIADHTVRTHVKHIYRKLQVNSRVQILSQHARGGNSAATR